MAYFTKLSNGFLLRVTSVQLGYYTVVLLEGFPVKSISVKVMFESITEECPALLLSQFYQ